MDMTLYFIHELAWKQYLNIDPLEDNIFSNGYKKYINIYPVQDEIFSNDYKKYVNIDPIDNILKWLKHISKYRSTWGFNILKWLHQFIISSMIHANSTNILEYHYLSNSK